LEKLLNPSQLAEILNVRPGTIYSWLSRGVDVPYVKIAGTVRFREKAVETWLAEKEKAKRKRNFEL
jgi:excisionase family DNA binding protein